MNTEAWHQGCAQAIKDEPSALRGEQPGGVGNTTAAEILRRADDGKQKPPPVDRIQEARALIAGALPILPATPGAGKLYDQMREFLGATQKEAQP